MKVLLEDLKLIPLLWIKQRRWRRKSMMYLMDVLHVGIMQRFQRNLLKNSRVSGPIIEIGQLFLLILCFFVIPIVSFTLFTVSIIQILLNDVLIIISLKANGTPL